MSPLYAYDGASPFDLEAAKEHGAILVTGYIVGHPGGMDPIAPARVRRIHELGLGFLPNWERGAAYLVTCSRSDGVKAGQEAVAALRALGVPDDGTVACAFSWDVAVHPTQYGHCSVVADGIIAGLAGRYLFTAYGQGGLIDRFATTGQLKSEGWLSASTSFPGYDAASPRVALVQRVGSPVAGTDQNLVTDPANVHAWWPADSPYARKDFSMDADAKAAFAALSAKIDGLPAAVLAKDGVPVNLDPTNPDWTTGNALAYLVRHVAALDPTKLAAALAAKLDVAGLSAAQIEQAVRAVFADAGTP